MRTFVTGATGFVGREVVRQLGAAGHRVRFLARRPEAPAARTLVDQLGAQAHPGDLLRPTTLAGAFEDVDAVIHLVGIISEVGELTFDAAHPRATGAALEAARAAGVRRFLHMSALGTRPGAASRYHQTKFEAEERVRRSGLDWTIFRPSLIYGREDHFVNLFANLARWSPVLPLLGSGRGRLQPVSVEAVARCFVGALTEPASGGKTYDVCGLERLTLAEVLDQILEVAGRRRWKLRVPLPLARLQARSLEWLFPRVLRRAPPLNRDQLIMLEEDNVGDPRPAQEQFGLELESFRDGIARYLVR